MQIVAYQTDEITNSPNLKWLGFIKGDGGLLIPIRFNGASKEEVKKKASEWLQSQRKPKPWEEDTTEEAFAEYVASNPVEPTVKKVFPSQRPSQGPGRGHGNAGRIWVVNRDTGDRKRIQESELKEYIGLGYMKGKKL